MSKISNEENRDFSRRWAVVRKKGFFYYFRTKIVALGVMMFLIFIIDTFISQNINYKMAAIICIGITLFAPIFSWGINEFRYRKSKR